MNKKETVMNVLLFFTIVLFCTILGAAQTRSDTYSIEYIDTILSRYPDIKTYTVGDSYSYAYPVVPKILDQAHASIVSSRYIYEIPQAEVFSWHRFIVTHGTLIKDFCRGRELKVWSNINKYSQPTYFKGKIAVITESFVDCYYHYMQLLGQLSLLHRTNTQYDYVYTVLRKPFQKEYLKLFGIPESRIIDADKYPHITADALLVSKSFGVARALHPYDVTTIRNIVLPRIEKQQNKPRFSKKIFISRKDTKKRQLLNEDTIFSLFERFGFKRYVLSQLSIADQIALFHKATHIIACHGSGLSNLIFCEPGTKVVELFQNARSAFFTYLSYDCALEYRCIVAPKMPKGKRNGHTYIEPKFIKNFIQEHDAWLR